MTEHEDLLRRWCPTMEASFQGRVDPARLQAFYGHERFVKDEVRDSVISATRRGS